MPTPRATYRLQLRPGFGFEAAAGVADYLRELGISHLYASPYLQAAPGSTHGYDVVDPTRVSAELGGEAGRARLAERLTELGLGQVLDIVPNHMATAPENAWWWDLLRNGPASVYEAFFDVDWDPPEPKLRNQVLMPILGDHYGRELEAGRIRLEHDAGHFTVRYFEHRLPAAPRSIGPLLVAADERAGSGGELGFLGRALATLVKPGVAEEAARAVRERDLAVLDRRVRELVEHDEALAAAVDAVVAEVNADPDALDAFLSAQNYRLAYWRTAGQELDYRRFFDIDTLAALRTEDPRVFDAVHTRVLGWIRTGELDGVRVDHPDGLRDPAAYFRRLRDAAPDAWIVAEKILAPGEPRPSWPTDGTTGYRLLNDIGGLFVDPQGEATLTGLWRAITGDEREYADVAYAARMDVLRDVLGADLNRLANVFVQLCERHRRYRDFARRELRDALAEVAACFPVYRTYVTGAGAAASDRGVIAEAVRRARERAPGLDPELVEFLGAVLSGEVAGPAAQGLRMRFQQLTAPAAAKGEEDTAFYRYLRLAALSEVGGTRGGGACRWTRSMSGVPARRRNGRPP